MIPLIPWKQGNVQWGLTLAAWQGLFYQSAKSSQSDDYSLVGVERTMGIIDI